MILEALRQLFESSNVSILALDLQLRVKEWNRKTTDITGFTFEEAYQKNFIDSFIHPSDQDVAKSAFTAVLNGCEPSNHKLSLMKKNHDEAFLLISVSPRKDENDKIIGGEFCVIKLKL